FFSSRRRHTRSDRDWSSDVCSSDLCHRDAAQRATAITAAVCSGGLVLTFATHLDGSALRVRWAKGQRSPAGAYENWNAFSRLLEIGRASCRERVSVRVVAL